MLTSGFPDSPRRHTNSGNQADDVGILQPYARGAWTSPTDPRISDQSRLTAGRGHAVFPTRCGGPRILGDRAGLAIGIAQEMMTKGDGLFPTPDAIAKEVRGRFQCRMTSLARVSEIESRLAQGGIDASSAYSPVGAPSGGPGENGSHEYRPAPSAITSPEGYC